MHAHLIKFGVLAVLALVMLTACASGPRQVRGELPLVTLESLERQGDRITLLLGLRNFNDSPFPLTAIEVRLSSGDQRLLSVAHEPDFEITPRGREILTLRGIGEPEGLSLLDRFDPDAAARENQEPLRRIDWTMQVQLSDERGRARTTEASGFLHPVPGQPGRFR